MIYLAADHGGFKLKEALKKDFDNVGLEYQDMGADTLDPKDDYPDYAIKAAKKVSENPETDKAILMCKSGTGEVIAANKFNNVRATLSWNVEHAKKAREHNNTNILALPADYISEEEAKEIVGNWLNTDFTEEERHVRRLKKIGDVEK